MNGRSAASIFWGLALVAIGGVLLARNMGYQIPIWSSIARYWPVLIIVWGLVKLVDYFRFRGDGRSLFSAGEVVLLIFIILAGSAVTVAANISPNFAEFLDAADIDLWDITGNNYEYTERHELEAAEGSAIEVINRYGSVVVTPHTGSRIVVDVQKTVRAADRAEADRLAGQFQYSIVEEGGGYRVISNMNRDQTFQGLRYRTSLSIQVPARSMLTIDNRNGRVQVSDLTGDQRVTNGYGDVEIQRIQGGVTIENRNGRVTVNEAAGAVRINNQYAGVDARNIGAALDIRNRNGAVTIAGVQADAQVSNAYASVEVRDVTGRLDLTTTNGTVEVENVGAGAKVTNAYARTSVTGVGGALEVQNRHGAVEVSNVKGNAVLSTSYARISASNVEGELSISGRNNGVEIDGAGRDVSVESSYQNVDIRDARGAIRVGARNGDVRIGLSAPPASDVSVSSEYGNVTVQLPAGSSFSVDARAVYGQINSDFEGLADTSRDRNRRLSGSMGAGGPAIDIETRNGNINLVRR